MFRSRPVTVGLAAFLLAVYLVVEVPGGSIGFLLFGSDRVPGGVALLAVWPPAIEGGQYWRLLTATFVHAGLVHLFLNLVGLFALGLAAERRFGRGRLAAVFICAALMGNIAATVSSPETLTLGASGGLMGVAGGLITLMVRYRLERETLMWVVGGVVSTLLYGFLHSGVSNAAHIAGVVTGFGITWVIGASPNWVASEHRLEEAASAVERKHIDQIQADARGAMLFPDSVLSDPANRRVIQGAGSRRVALLIVGLLAFGVITGVGFLSAQALLIVLGALMTAVCLLAGVQSLYQRLTLTPIGFTYRSLGRGGFACPWADVDSFEPYVVSTGYSTLQMVRCNVLQRDPAGTRLAKKYFPAIGGMDGVQQAALLEDWRALWAPWHRP
jgi:membrane associated rhomboid family serine protease